MHRTRLLMTLAVLAATLALPGVARAQTFTWHVNYYDNSHTSGAPDAKVRIVNSGAVFPLSPAGDICAMIYVFDPIQELQTCCGCLVTPNGLLTLSVDNDLNTNVLSPAGPTASGVIKVVESLPNVPPGTARPGSSATCDPGSLAVPTGLDFFLISALEVSGTHVQDAGSGTFQLTETADHAFSHNFTDLTTAEPFFLALRCFLDVQTNGSGFGRCHCPGEKTAALDPPPLPTPTSLPTGSAPASTTPNLSAPKLSGPTPTISKVSTPVLSASTASTKLSNQR